VEEELERKSVGESIATAHGKRFIVKKKA
jgi:hypothetical protein